MAKIFEPSEPGFIDEWMREYYGPGSKLRIQLLGYGKHPALLIIDMQTKIPTDGLVGRATRNTALLLEEARKQGIPVIYTVMAYREDLKDFIPLKLASMTSNIVGTPEVEVTDALRPRGELVIAKRVNSAFIGTNLSSFLVQSGVDTVIVTGAHTGGCVRATASDSFSYGFRTIIPEECVGDGKGIKPHRANLCDLHIRGADVVRLENVLQYLESIGTHGEIARPIQNLGRIEDKR